jgi:16S rRNA (uracil1498-N3)-methyltransferase
VHRFYAPDITAGSRIALPAEEARHATRVLRLKAGAQVVVFDGRGLEYVARIEDVSPTSILVAAIGAHAPAAEARVPVTLAQGLLKSDKMDRVIRDAVMLGAAAVQPFLSARTELPRAVLRTQGRRVRWERIALSSVKQSGRAVIPPVHDICEFGDVVRLDGGARYVLVEPAAAPEMASKGIASFRDQPPPQRAIIMVGPEGGWAPDELQLAVSSGMVPLTLGSRTLRADAAGAAALTLLGFLWGDR